jgi:hypothetical protein
MQQNRGGASHPGGPGIYHGRAVLDQRAMQALAHAFTLRAATNYMYSYTTPPRTTRTPSTETSFWGFPGHARARARAPRGIVRARPVVEIARLV